MRWATIGCAMGPAKPDKIEDAEHEPQQLEAIKGGEPTPPKPTLDKGKGKGKGKK